MNVVSDFDRHNIRGHSLCTFLAKYNLLNDIWQSNIDEMGDMKRKLVLFLFYRSFRKVITCIWLKFKPCFGKYPSIVYLYN